MASSVIRRGLLVRWAWLGFLLLLLGSLAITPSLARIHISKPAPTGPGGEGTPYEEPEGPGDPTLEPGSESTGVDPISAVGMEDPALSGEESTETLWERATRWVQSTWEFFFGGR